MEKIKEINILKLVVGSLFGILPISYIVGNLTFELNILSIIVTFIFLINKKSFCDVFDKNEFVLFLILIIYLQLNTIISENWQISFRRNFFYFRYYLLIISFRYFFNNNYFNFKIINFWIIIILITTGDIIYEYIRGYNLLGYQSYYDHRIASFFKDELIVGSFIFAFLFPILSFLYIKKKYISYIIFLIISFIAITISGERSVFFKMVIASMAVFYLWEYKTYYKKYIAFILIIILSLSYYTVPFEKIFPKQIDRYIVSIKKLISRDNKLPIKQNLLKTQYLNQAIVTYEMLRIKLYLGMGNKTYFKSCHKYMNEDQRKYCFTHPHQIYYELGSEHGILGSLLVIFILLKLIFLSSNQLKNNLNIKRLHIFRMYLYLTFIPLIPSGSFFSSNVSLLFWLNFFFYTFYRDILINDEKFKQN